MRHQPNRVIKHCAYGLTLLAVFLLQSSRGTAMTVWGMSLDLIPFFVTALALFEGPYTAGWFGFAAGFLSVIATPMVDGLMSLFYGVLGILCGLIAKSYMRPVLPGALLLGAIVAVLKGLIGQVFYYGLVYSFPLISGVLHICGGVVLSLAPAALLFFWVRALNRRFAEREEL